MRILTLIFALLPLPALADVTIFAASSLKTVLDQVAADWQGEPLVLSYGGSAALAKQIAQGAPADIFISASEEWMDDLASKSLIQPATRHDIAGNTLILIAHDARPLVKIAAGMDLAALLGDGKLSMAFVDSVPAGQYGKAALESLGLWASVEPMVVQSENVRAALALVASGEAALGVVYASDAVAEPGVTVLGTFPGDSHPAITYPAALVTGAHPAAQAFLDHLTSPAAQKTFAAQGFLPPP
jgi:molybdate transport system substrate-binding protein